MCELQNLPSLHHERKLETCLNLEGGFDLKDNLETAYAGAEYDMSVPSQLRSWFLEEKV